MPLEPTEEMLRGMFASRMEGTAWTAPWDHREGAAWKARMRADEARVFAYVRDIVLEETAVRLERFTVPGPELDDDNEDMQAALKMAIRGVRSLKGDKP